MDKILIRHLNLLLYHEMALRDQMCFVWLQKKPVFCLEKVSWVSPFWIILPTSLITFVSWTVMRLRTISHCFLLLYCTVVMFCIVALTGGITSHLSSICVFQLFCPFSKMKAWTLDVCVNSPTVLVVLSKIPRGFTDRARLEIHEQASLENRFISRKDAQTNGTAISLWREARHTNFPVSPLTSGMKD